MVGQGNFFKAWTLCASGQLPALLTWCPSVPGSLILGPRMSSLTDWKGDHVCPVIPALTGGGVDVPQEKDLQSTYRRCNHRKNRGHGEQYS